MTEGANTYQLQPKEDEKFYASKAKTIIEQVFNERLKGSVYDPSSSAQITEQLTRIIRSRVKQLRAPRYKIAVQVFYGQLKGQGLRVGSKCLWDPNFDNWASHTFSNESIHCTGIVFGVYTE